MKKIFFTVIMSMFFITVCWSQDTIRTKTDEIISAKVLEVTISEIKYKKFDNIDGPTYTMLKSDVYMIGFENGTKDIITPKKSASSHNAIIYVYRMCRYVGSLTTVKLYFNDELVCSIPTCTGYACSVSKTGKYVLLFKGGGCFSSKEVVIDVIPDQQEYYVRYDIRSTGCSFSVLPPSFGSKDFIELTYKNEIKVN
jgi:hypothetical protein